MENGKFLYDLLVKRIHSYLWITAGPSDITPIALASPPCPNQDSPFSDATPSPASRASRHTRRSGRSGRSVARSSSYAGGATVTSPESRNPSTRGLRNGGEGLGDDLGNHLIHVWPQTLWRFLLLHPFVWMVFGIFHPYKWRRRSWGRFGKLGLPICLICT